MIRFEDLAANVQALILAKLAAELAAHNAANIHHLAKMQNTDLMGVWRHICRIAGQPVCTIPAAATTPDH